MQERKLFEYAVLRIVPKVEREEFINVGVILYCRDAKFLGAKQYLDTAKLQMISKDIDLDVCAAYLHAFMDICHGKAADSPIAQYELSERFRWLTANRSSVLQTSPVHPGLCQDPQQTLDRLFDLLVL